MIYKQLVERAVKNAKVCRNYSVPRWVAVMETFAVGSTTAHVLCRLYGLDPDELGFNIPASTGS